MEKLKLALTSKVREEFKNSEHKVREVEIHEIKIERHPGGKRTGIAKMLIDYKEGGSNWVEKPFEFKQENYSNNINIIMDTNLRSNRMIGEMSHKDILENTLEEAEKILLRISNDVLEYCKDVGESTKTFDLLASLATNMYFNVIDAKKDLNRKSINEVIQGNCDPHDINWFEETENGHKREGNRQPAKIQNFASMVTDKDKENILKRIYSKDSNKEK